ncbi:MAG: hypothetical protein LAT66_04400 [Alkalimonas sp.]|nr:hypothetical protein [Alkalimonas sp.]
MSHILLARPHPFIVSEMAPFLQDQGHSFSKLTQLDALNEQLSQAKAAVISLALSSPLAHTAEEVVTAIRQKNARLPLVFASLLPLDRVQKNILQLLEQHHPAASVVSATSTLGSGRPGQPDTALYFSKDDLNNPDSRRQFAQLLKQHAL